MSDEEHEKLKAGVAALKDYTLKHPIYYFSPRYLKRVTVPEGFKSDGATGAFDIDSNSWWVHDKICQDGAWDDGSPVTRKQAATVLSDILWSEGRFFRATYWGVASYWLGCKKVRNNV